MKLRYVNLIIIHTQILSNYTKWGTQSFESVLKLFDTICVFLLVHFVDLILLNNENWDFRCLLVIANKKSVRDKYSFCYFVSDLLRYYRWFLGKLTSSKTSFLPICLSFSNIYQHCSKERNYIAQSYAYTGNSKRFFDIDCCVVHSIR